MKRAVFGFGLAVLMLSTVGVANAFILDLSSIWDKHVPDANVAASAFSLDFSGLDFFSNPTDTFNYFGGGGASGSWEEPTYYYDDHNANDEVYTVPETYYYPEEEIYFDDINIYSEPYTLEDTYVYPGEEYYYEQYYYSDLPFSDADVPPGYTYEEYFGFDEIPYYGYEEPAFYDPWTDTIEDPYYGVLPADEYYFDDYYEGCDPYYDPYCDEYYDYEEYYFEDPYFDEYVEFYGVEYVEEPWYAPIINVFTPQKTRQTKPTVTQTVREPAQAPPSCSISASPNRISKGSSSTLSLDSVNATRATISGIGSVPTLGFINISPSSSQNYTVTVTGPGGSSTCATSIAVDQQQVKPGQLSCVISANPRSIERGGSSTLVWAGTGAVSASLSGVGAVPVNSSRAVYPNESRSYTLTVRASDGRTANCSTDVSVASTPPPPPPPPAPQTPSCTLNISPSTVGYGGTTRMEWNSFNASNASIDGVGSVTLNGSSVIVPSISRTYTMTVWNSSGTQSTCFAHVNVQEQRRAPWCTISASPNSVYPGGSSVLSWSSTDATGAHINGVGNVPASGFISVSVANSQTYSMTVNGPGGSNICSTSIGVRSFPPITPRASCDITARPASIRDGSSSLLSWTSKSASSAWLSDGIGAVRTGGSLIVRPESSRRYILTVSGVGGSGSCSINLSVTGAPKPNFPTCNISASPKNITPGSQTRLSWSSTNAISVTIDGGIGTVSVSGSRTIAPTQTKTYTMTASGSGGTRTCSTEVTVSAPQTPTCTLTCGETVFLCTEVSSVPSCNTGSSPNGPNVEVRQNVPVDTSTEDESGFWESVFDKWF